MRNAGDKDFDTRRGIHHQHSWAWEQRRLLRTSSQPLALFLCLHSSAKSLAASSDRLQFEALIPDREWGAECWPPDGFSSITGPMIRTTLAAFADRGKRPPTSGRPNLTGGNYRHRYCRRRDDCKSTGGNPLLSFLSLEQHTITKRMKSTTEEHSRIFY